MRHVSAKATTLRTAIARAELAAAAATIDAVREDRAPKGDPLPVAKVAAVQAAKKTAEWIPYCHNIPIEGVDVDFELLDDRIAVNVKVTSVAKTGVEMEAMVAASTARTRTASAARAAPFIARSPGPRACAGPPG